MSSSKKGVTLIVIMGGVKHMPRHTNKVEGTLLMQMYKLMSLYPHGCVVMSILDLCMGS